MRILIFIIFTFLIASCYSQNVSFGIPSIEKELQTGELIILNVPNHVDGRFKASVELDNLRAFLQLHSKLTFVLTIHIFGGNSEFCLDYSKFLSRDLKRLLNCNNVVIEGKGNGVPLLLDKKSPRYFNINSRIELVVKKDSNP